MKMPRPLVSIVIPLFNKADWIAQTMASVANQDYDNWECIIVDDGSTDGSFELVSSLVEKLPGKWRLIRQENSGQSIARNHGLELASGDFVALLDADDIWFKEKLTKQVAYMSRFHEVDILFTSYVIFEESLSAPLRYIRFRSARKMIHRWLQMYGFGGLIESTGLIRRTFIQTNGSFDLGLSTSSGLDVSIRGLIFGRVAVLKEALVGYRLSDNQWHKQLDELSHNCLELSNRYGEKLSSVRSIQDSQNAYFEWDKLRGGGRTKPLRKLLVSIVTLNGTSVRMLLALIFRNLRSTTLGFQHRRLLSQSIGQSTIPPDTK